jgi:hypothetical protein
VLDFTKVDDKEDDSGDHSCAVGKHLFFGGRASILPALVWSCRLRVSLYNTYIKMKLCFCSFRLCILFVGIQPFRKTFRPLNKFITKMHIFDVHPCTNTCLSSTSIVVSGACAISIGSLQVLVPYGSLLILYAQNNLCSGALAPPFHST